VRGARRKRIGCAQRGREATAKLQPKGRQLPGGDCPGGGFRSGNRKNLRKRNRGGWRQHRNQSTEGTPTVQKSSKKWQAQIDAAFAVPRCPSTIQCDRGRLGRQTAGLADPHSEGGEPAADRTALTQSPLKDSPGRKNRGREGASLNSHMPEDQPCRRRAQKTHSLQREGGEGSKFPGAGRENGARPRPESGPSLVSVERRDVGSYREGVQSISKGRAAHRRAAP